ncbi:DsbA family oxidoreductase [Halobellus captivus]|uniref:DsbA family oxidoreductase n=1 Tax=Halobellus captivus TaxID=2592614 RepID=UPI0011A9CBAF|nr:DsbA family protein [Halobellus captivus]
MSDGTSDAGESERGETAESEREPITIYSDYVCPFCYLGRRSLSAYQAERDAELPIEWRPFDLRSGKRNADGTIDHDADDGKDDAYYEQATQNVKKLREKYGADEMQVELATDVDSLPAQLVSVAVREQYDYETWLAFDEGVFEALWHDGHDIGDESVLVDIAESAGIDVEVVRDVLGDEERRAALREQFREAQRRGITGVPTFVYDEHAARGAVPPEQLERLVEGV